MADKSDSQEKDIDELDGDFGSDDENADPNVFRITNALTPPSAISYSAQELHSELTAILDWPLSNMPQRSFTRGILTSIPATNEVRFARRGHNSTVHRDRARSQTSSGQRASKLGSSTLFSAIFTCPPSYLPFKKMTTEKQ